MTHLDDIGEDGVVDRLRGWLQSANCGRELLGDDCAVVPSSDPDFDELLTSDAVVEGVHFEAGVDPDRIGRKAVSRALSDIAAMGGEPQYLLLNIGVPSAFPVSGLKSMVCAARDRAAEFGAVIAGGDLTRMDRQEVHVFCQGRVRSGHALRRKGAQGGDGLFITGCLGGSLQGRHLDFMPRIREALWLRDHAAPTAMMDVSDGLAADLPRLAAESQVGARVNLDALPVSVDVPEGNAVCALTEGEDYELLFTASLDKSADWALSFQKEFGISVSRIGDILPIEDGLMVVTRDGAAQDWPRGGYKHF